MISHDAQHLLDLLNRYDAICTADPHNTTIAMSWDETWRKLRAQGIRPVWNEKRKCYEMPVAVPEEGKEIMQEDNITQVDSVEQFVMNGEQDLQELADAGNSIAREWLLAVQAAPIAIMKLSLFGDLKIALLHDARPEARAVAKVLFPQ